MPACSRGLAETSVVGVRVIAKGRGGHPSWRGLKPWECFGWMKGLREGRRAPSCHRRGLIGPDTRIRPVASRCLSLRQLVGWFRAAGRSEVIDRYDLDAWQSHRLALT